MFLTSYVQLDFVSNSLTSVLFPLYVSLMLLCLSVGFVCGVFLQILSLNSDKKDAHTHRHTPIKLELSRDALKWKFLAKNDESRAKN